MYGPLQSCFAQKRLLCHGLLLKHLAPVITTLTTSANCCVLAPAHFFHLDCDTATFTLPQAIIISCTIIPVPSLNNVPESIYLRYIPWSSCPGFPAPNYVQRPLDHYHPSCHLLGKYIDIYCWFHGFKIHYVVVNRPDSQVGCQSLRSKVMNRGTTAPNRLSLF
jgi:hypothetical protein